MIRLLRFLKPFSASVACICIFVNLQSLANLYLPVLMSRIVDGGIVRGDIAYIIRTGGVMLLITLGGITCAMAAGWLAAKTANSFGKLLRRQIFSHIEHFSQYEFDQFGSPSLITRTTNDVTQVQFVTLMALRRGPSIPLTFIGGVIMAASLDATLSLVLAAAVPVMGTAMYVIQSQTLPLYRTIQARIDRITLVLREHLGGARVIRAFNRTGYENARFDEVNRDLVSTTTRVNIIMPTLLPVAMLVMNFTIIAIIWFGGIRIDAGRIQVGTVMAFIQYVELILFALVGLSFMFVWVPKASASAERINEVLCTVPGIRDAVQDGTGGMETEPAEHAAGQAGLVEFRNVTFCYPGAEQPALSNISFKAAPGEVTAIIGGTGSGKSTLTSLILRCYDATSGAVCVGGVDVRRLPLAELRGRIGLVPQKTVLFAGTVADNIRFGREEATDEEVRNAADTAQAIEFISRLPDGFDTAIARGGVNLSGGQRQRLAIARALVRRPAIYIFDDSFSALDFKTEARLRRALGQETVGATVFFVAQRVGTVIDADRIIVLDEGRMVGIGSHRELVSTCTVYRQLIASQLGEEGAA